jgi:hypothetical protein
MERSRFAASAFLILATICALAGSGQMQAQDNKNPYPSMAPREQYLMPDRNAEIALARTAAPGAISRDATILVLTAHGYETAVEGKNGWTCAVERGFGGGPIDTREWWNPKNRSPVCYNPQAVRLALPLTIKRAELAMAGKTREQIKEWAKTAYAKKELPTTVEPGAMAYMISKEAYLSDGGSHNLCHLMFYVPLDKANWGEGLDNSPVIPFVSGPPEPFKIFLIPVGNWSDGTPVQ